MSRSYKHMPICKGNGKSHKIAKRQANKKYRKANIDVMTKSNYHKKYNESFDIADYVCYWPKEKAIQEYNNGKNKYLKNKYPTIEEYLRFWEKTMIKK